MANTTSPRSNRFKGWFYDAVNDRLEYWYNGTKIGHLDNTGMDITDDSTARMTNGLIANAGIAAGLKTQQVKLGSIAAVASNGAEALLALTDMSWIAPADCKIVSAWRMNHTASDVTKGTATTSASYRRMTLVCNTAAAGTGTHVVASQNATASQAVSGTRAFTVVASTVPAGAVVRVSHVTVGAATADGTDIAASDVWVAYELV